MNRGWFISLDGIDGAGKTTQCQLLADWLRERGHLVVVCRDPGSTPVGDRIRELLLDSRSAMEPLCESYLYMASRAQLVQQIVQPALSRGETVVCDRFLLATVVYQGHAGGLAPEKLWDIGLFGTGGLLPDLTLVLDLEERICAERKQGPRDRMESKGDAFVQKVRRGFLTEARRDPARIRVIDASQPVEFVARAIREEVGRVLVQHPRT